MRQRHVLLSVERSSEMNGSVSNHEEETHPIWVCVADSRRARLLRCGRNSSGSCMVSQCGEIESALPAKGRAQPSPNRRRSGGDPDAQDCRTNGDRRRFAKAVVNWLRHSIDSTVTGRLAVVAPPRFLGALRRAQVGRLAQGIEERCCDLTHLGEAALAKHTVIQGLVEPAWRFRPTAS